MKLKPLELNSLHFAVIFHNKRNLLRGEAKSLTQKIENGRLFITGEVWRFFWKLLKVHGG